LTENTRVEAIIEKSLSDIVRAPVIKSDVRRDGSRAIDTAYLEIPNGYKVAINDTVSYIQDDVPLDNLFAVWNFQGSYRDEGGYHHDGKIYKAWDGASAAWIENVTDTDFVYPNELGNSGKYRANYGIKLTAAGKEIKIEEDPSGIHTASNSLLDFTGQFDIIINFKNMQSTTLSTHFNGATNNTMILFSKYDTTNSRGVQVGLKLVSSKWVVYAKLDSTTFTGDLTLFPSVSMAALGYIDSAQGGATRMIRFYRDHDGVVRLSLDNNTDGNDCVKTPAEQLVRTTADAYIGTNNENVEGTTTNNYDFNGFIFQVRLYCGGYLEHGDVEALMSAGAQQMTQKVSGKVWQKEDTLDRIKIDTKSRSKTLLETNITPTILNNNITSGNTTDSEPATHIRNVFEGNQDMSNILKTIVSKIDKEFIFFRHRSTSSNNVTHADSKFMADGGFLSNVEVLMIMSRRGFLTFPTKTFIWEYGAHEVSTNLNSGYTFSDSEYQLYNRGDNDNKIINDIEVYGDIQKGHHVINFGALSSFTLNTAHTTNFAYPPHNVRIYEGTSSTFTQSESSRVPSAQYWIDFNGKELTFSDVTWTGQASAPDNYIWATYDFDITDEVSSAMGGTGQMTRHSKTKFNSDGLAIEDTGSSAAVQERASIAHYGQRSGRMYIPQLLMKQDFQTIRQQLIDEFCNFDNASGGSSAHNPKLRYTITAPFLVNCLRENLGVTLSSTTMKFTNAAGAEADTTKLLPVKSIQWKFPEMVTIIEVGDFAYDLFEFYKTTTDTANSTASSLLPTRS